MSSQSSLAVIRFSGELDVGRREEIRRALQLGATSGPILIDLHEVPYADSTVIAELLRFRTEALAAGHPFAVLIGSRQLKRLLEYAGIDRALPIFDDRAAALTHLRADEPAREEETG